MKYNIEDLLYEEVFHARQINEQIKLMINQLPYSEKVSIIRIGDKLFDEL